MVLLVAPLFYSGLFLGVFLCKNMSFYCQSYRFEYKTLVKLYNLFDINNTQNISIRRSKKLYELREKISKYIPSLVQLLKGSDEFFLPMHLQSKYQTYYNHALYGAWTPSLPMHDVGTKFSFYGNSFMIPSQRQKMQILVCSSFFMYSFLPKKQ